jgi:hypothetical protein
MQNVDGILMCAGRLAEQCGDNNNQDDPMEFTKSPLKEEPSRVAFVAPNVKIGMVIVPDSISARDESSPLSAGRLSPMFEPAYIFGTGHASNADAHYRRSAETTHDHVVKSDGRERVRGSMIANIGSKRAGRMNVKVGEASCSPEVSSEWGKL